MDPYLEPYWSDVYTRLMIHLSNQLQRQLPQGLRAAVEESVRIDDEDGFEIEPSLYIPDVAVSEAFSGSAHPPSPASEMVLAEPVCVHARPSKERHIEIVATRSGHHVVTVIEVLSPTNKSSERERSKFLDKRDRYLASEANYVEIDLLRGGAPLPPSVPEERESVDVSDYLVRVFRSYKEIWEIYPIHLRERLPAFRIPLRHRDPDVAIDLQRAIDAAYEEGAYDRAINYTAPPSPPFSDEDGSWAATVLSPLGDHKRPES